MTNSANSDGKEPVDFSRIQETSDGDMDFEQELFAVFLEDCDERLHRLRAAVAAGDAEVIRREAHTIKGAGANVGTNQLHTIAASMESLGGSGASDELEGLLERLSAEYARVKDAISAYLGAG